MCVTVSYLDSSVVQKYLAKWSFKLRKGFNVHVSVWTAETGLN